MTPVWFKQSHLSPAREIKYIFVSLKKSFILRTFNLVPKMNRALMANLRLSTTLMSVDKCSSKWTSKLSVQMARESKMFSKFHPIARAHLCCRRIIAEMWEQSDFRDFWVDYQFKYIRKFSFALSCLCY